MSLQRGQESPERGENEVQRGRLETTVYGPSDFFFRCLDNKLPRAKGSCKKSLRVLEGHNLIGGALPDAVASWDRIQVLDVQEAYLSGWIPDAAATWTQIAMISLTWNRLAGTIPGAADLWSSLTKISVCFNAISGTIPNAAVQTCAREGIGSGGWRIRSRPGKPNQKRGQNEKFMNFAHFCEFWCFSFGKTSTIHIELLFRNAPAKSS